ncbi:hypothetical protein JTB14_032194 [Gonioctena quinquepunctata]|nr:hypothetical protein JTB14_032194 [Gonioctena quinquepunctata]
MDRYLKKFKDDSGRQGQEVKRFEYPDGTVQPSVSGQQTEGIPLTPTIVEVGVKPMVIYYVYFEKENIGNDGEATFLDALKVAYAYFILNIKYPKDLSTTMEFLQRMFLKIHPDSGSKSKKVSAVRKKVFNFINKLVTTYVEKYFEL